MPSEPLHGIIYRELAVANAGPVIAVANPLLTELVNYASNAIVRCATSSTSSVDEDLSMLSLYRHVIEMTDGAAILVSQASATPAIVLLRSSFEALISLEYMISDPAQFSRRSLSWLVGYVHQRLGMYRSLDPDTPAGQDSEVAPINDMFIRDALLPLAERANEAADKLEKFLSRPHVAPINEAFLALRGKKAWYRLDKGPNDIKALASRVGRPAWYEFLYKYWSRLTHAQDFAGLLTKTAEGESTIRPIRHPEELRNVANFAATIMLAATRQMIAKYHPGEDIKSWYMREVRSLYLKLSTRGDAV